MKKPVYNNNFKKDIELAKKRGKNMSKIKAAMDDLIMENPLPPYCNNHPLFGKYKGYKDCHIEPDWLLLYKIDGEYIIFSRTGTHSDLFK